MRLLVQRVASAKVEVDGKIVGKIGRGLLVFFGVHKGDAPDKAPAMAGKLCNLRIFPDENGKMNLSCKDVGGDVLVVSQFTLYGDCSRGRRPSFVDALGGDEAETIYERFASGVKNEMGSVQTGEFGAEMQVSLINDGPATFLVEN
jgi:D-aminoacyl-tRNA deacylase